MTDVTALNAYSQSKKKDTPNEVPSGPASQPPPEKARFAHADGLVQRTPYRDGANYPRNTFEAAAVTVSGAPQVPDAVKNFTVGSIIEGMMDNGVPVNGARNFIRNASDIIGSADARQAAADAIRAVGNLAHAFGVPFAAVAGSAAGGMVDLSHLRNAKKVLIPINNLMLTRSEVTKEQYKRVLEAERSLKIAFEMAGLHQD
ncbi:MAG: hypothetical protein EOO28_20785 [Comamonadaceae bacterium]|nr:MAG: hypothetical protein EOO28_20785 [Comamonadaceae bacterium]